MFLMFDFVRFYVFYNNKKKREKSEQRNQSNQKRVQKSWPNSSIDLHQYEADI